MRTRTSSLEDTPDSLDIVIRAAIKNGTDFAASPFHPRPKRVARSPGLMFARHGIVGSSDSCT
jgi:hypothetical protein